MNSSDYAHALTPATGRDHNTHREDYFSTEKKKKKIKIFFSFYFKFFFKEEKRPATRGYMAGRRTPGEIRIRVKREKEREDGSTRAHKDFQISFFFFLSKKGCRIHETRNCANLARLGRAHPPKGAGAEPRESRRSCRPVTVRMQSPSLSGVG